MDGHARRRRAARGSARRSARRSPHRAELASAFNSVDRRRAHARDAVPDFIPAFVLSGIGMALFFVPVASVVLGEVPRAAESVASGTNNALRELGGCSASRCSAGCSPASAATPRGASYVAGLMPALRVGVAVVVVGAPLAHHLPARCRPDPLPGPPSRPLKGPADRAGRARGRVRPTD